MIRLLKTFADWLDKRFPPKVHVTEDSFNSLLRQETGRTDRINSHEATLADHRVKIASLEKTIAAIKDHLAKGGAVGPAAELRRAEFIANGRLAE